MNIGIGGKAILVGPWREHIFDCIRSRVPWLCCLSRLFPSWCRRGWFRRWEGNGYSVCKGVWTIGRNFLPTTVLLEKIASVWCSRLFRCWVEMDNCATSAGGLYHIDSVDVSFNKRVMGVGLSRWQVGANVYVYLPRLFATDINLNNRELGGRAINRYSCVSRRRGSLCAASLSAATFFL